MVDRFNDPLLTPKETARHLQVPVSTMYAWLSEEAGGAPLVHRVPPGIRGHPSVPFIAIVEAHVLRSLRDLGLSKSAIREAAGAVRREFDTPFGLATRRIVTDGVDIFVYYAESDELERARDAQRPLRDVIDGYLQFITWADDDEYPYRLRLRQYPDVAPVIIDPRFGWGAPVLSSSKVPVEAVVELWQAGEPMETVADEYGLTRDEVEAICRTAGRTAA